MNAKKKVEQIEETATDLIHQGRDKVGKAILPNDRVVLSKSLVSWFGIGVVAVLASLYGKTLWHKVLEARSTIVEKQNSDAKLDRALVETMDASDAVASY